MFFACLFHNMFNPGGDVIKKRLSTNYTNFHELSVGEKDLFIDSEGLSPTYA